MPFNDEAAKAYRRIKGFLVFVACFLLLFVLVPIIADLIRGTYVFDILPLLVIAGFGCIGIPMLFYYRNMVLEIRFDGEGNAIVETNGRTHVLRCEAFKKVEVINYRMQIAFYYDDGKSRLRLLHQHYHPADQVRVTYRGKKYTPNLTALKEHLPNAEFLRR